MIQNKPTIFISHIHADEATANTIEVELRNALLGAVHVFNSSNRRSLEPGDPFRDKIIETLKNSECTLVISSPDSVASPWVNFEAGGAWVSGGRVIPCCVKGMKPSSLPVPLSHLQGISLDSDDGLTALLKHIAQLAGLDYPVAYDVSAGVANIVATWKTGATAKQNDELITWMRRSERRPMRHVGSSASGFFRARNITATDPTETKQLPDYGLLSGDSVRCWIDVEGETKSRMYCFAADRVADLLDELPENTLLHGTLVCAGQIKVYSMPSWDPDDDRGIDYYTAWIVKDATKA
jgi:hypothetical protein